MRCLSFLLQLNNPKDRPEIDKALRYLLLEQDFQIKKELYTTGIRMKEHGFLAKMRIQILKIQQLYGFQLMELNQKSLYS